MKISICQQFTRHASLWLTCTAAVLLYFWFN